MDRQRIQFGDGKVVDDSGSRQTVVWTIGATLPPTGSEEAEREVAIAFDSRALVTMDFVDRFDHPELRVVFTASRNTAYVRVLSK